MYVLCSQVKSILFYAAGFVFLGYLDCIFVKIFLHTHTHLTALCPGLPRWASTRKVKTNLDFTEARDSEWQWHQLGHMQVCTSLQADNHARTPPSSSSFRSTCPYQCSLFCCNINASFLQTGCPSCHPTDSVKAHITKFISNLQLLFRLHFAVNFQFNYEKPAICQTQLLPKDYSVV